MLSNYVSVRLVEHIYEHGNPTSDLDIDYLVGYQLTNESFWKEIETINQQLSQQALTELRDYPTCHLVTGSFTYCGVAISRPALKGGAKRAKDAKAP